MVWGGLRWFAVIRRSPVERLPKYDLKDRHLVINYRLYNNSRMKYFIDAV